MHFPDDLYTQAFAKEIEHFHHTTEGENIQPMHMNDSVAFQS